MSDMKLVIVFDAWICGALEQYWSVLAGFDAEIAGTDLIGLFAITY